MYRVKEYDLQMNDADTYTKKVLLQAWIWKALYHFYFLSQSVSAVLIF